MAGSREMKSKPNKEEKSERSGKSYWWKIT